MEIYIPPSRAYKASTLSLGLTPELPDDVGVLEDAAKEIENAISHLKRSNKEIQDFDPNGDDPELVDAIAGNILALAKKEERLKKIREKLAALGANCDPCVDTETVAAKETSHTSSFPPPAEAGPQGTRKLPASAETPDSASGADRGNPQRENAQPIANLTERIRNLDLSQTPTEDLLEDGIDL